MLNEPQSKTESRVILYGEGHLYLVSMTAIRFHHLTFDVAQSPALLWAESDADAEAKAYLLAIQKFPATERFQHHTVFVSKVDSD